jgi:hypothetical protein
MNNHRIYYGNDIGVDGDIFFGGDDGGFSSRFGSEHRDVEGNKIERTKRDYPYSFSDYVRWINGKYRGQTKPFSIKLEEGKQFHTAYSDRMGGWDRDHFDACFNEQLPIGSGGMRHGRPHLIEKFLAAYFRDENLELVKIVDCCNHSSGFEIFRFDFIYTPPKKPEVKKPEAQKPRKRATKVHLFEISTEKDMPGHVKATYAKDGLSGALCGFMRKTTINPKDVTCLHCLNALARAQATQ